MTSTNENQPQYFDLHTTGIGYANRYRLVGAKGGRQHDEYPCVSIAALHGKKESPTTVYFDARISGADAKEALAKYADQINDRKAKVLIGFKLDGAAPEIFTLESGKRAGEQAVSLRGRLLWVNWIRIKADGEETYQEVYKSERQTSTENETPGDEKQSS